MNKDFLLPTSFIFDDSSLIDNIHQTFLDLQANADEQSVQGFLDESFSYLCADYQTEVAKELLPAISLCFSLYPQYSLPFANKFIKSNKSNEYLIISSAAIIYELTNNKIQIDFPDHHSFVDDCLKEILPQIQNQDSTILTILGQKISYQYHNSLILDLLLSIKLTEELFSNFYSYLFRKNLSLTNHKFDILLNKLIDAGFIKILSLSESSINNLLLIIEKQNINLFDENDKEILFFISQVARFTRMEGKSDINELTEETVLPFVALTSIYFRFPQFDFTFSEPKFTNILLDSVKKLNDKSSQKLNKVSINFILNNLNDIESNQLISKSTVAEIIIILVKKLIKIEFTVDKIFLLSLLFGYLVKESDELIPIIKQFVENEMKSLFDYIFNNLDEINNSIKLQKLNLNVFNKPFLIEYLNSKLETEKFEQTVYFLENFCLNVPTLTISTEILEKVEQNNLTSLLHIAKFMKKNLKEEDFQKIIKKIPKNIQISLSDEIAAEEMNIDELLLLILSYSHDNLDKSTQLFGSLFEKMITDKEMLQNHLLYAIDYYSYTPSFIRSFLNHYIYQYEKYKKDFMEAVNKRCNYNFYFNVIVPNNDFHLDDLPIPKSGIYVVDKLFKYANENKATYQLFLCLKNLACSFPFLFKNYSKQIFDLVLPNLDYFYLLFDNNANEKSKELAKIAYSALSFLFSTFKLPNILDDFLNRMITNILSFSNSQILSFLVILNYLFENTDLYKMIEIVFIKYNFLETLQILHGRKIEEGENFEKFYNFKICLLIARILIAFTTLSQNDFSKFELYIKLDNPLTEYFKNDFKRLPDIQITPIECDHFSKQIQDFINNTEHQREFWIFDQTNIKMPNDYQIYTFTNKLQAIYDMEIDTKGLLPEETKHVSISFSNIKPYFETLFRIVTMESINENSLRIFSQAFSSICSYCDNITSYIDFLISNIKEFNENNIGSDSPSSLKVMQVIIEVLSIFAQNNKLSLNQAIEVLSIVLSPKWRNDSKLIMKTVCLLRFYQSLPVSILHAVEFDVLQSKIIGERDISTIEKFCDNEKNQFIVNQYYKHYSDLGKKTAIIMYGILIKDGICLKSDIPLALTYIKKAIEFEDPTAITIYSLMLIEGKGVEKNVDEGIKLLQKAVDNESDIAMNSYGEMIQKGYNIEKNVHKAVSLYQKAIDKYNMKALYNLAQIIYTDHEHIYYDFKGNVFRALLFFKKAADQGILDSMYMYGMLGHKVNYIVKAAQKGHSEAIKIYISYIINCESEWTLPENLEWLQKGVELGIKGASYAYSCSLTINNKGNLVKNLLDYANEDNINAMTEYHREQWRNKGFTGNSYEGFAQEADQYIDILKQYKKDNTKVFVDENFHPFKNWKRIDEIYDVPLFKRELIDPNFIIQGEIGDCCLISALSRAAKQFYLIPELFNYKLPNKILGVVENSMNIKCGAVVVNFHAFGRITPVLIDTLIPVTEEGIPLFSHPIDKTKSPWFCLVEKAFMKLNGSFLGVDGISFESALYSMFFTYSKMFEISPNNKVINHSTNKECSLTFDKINEYYNNGCVINATVHKSSYGSNSLKGLFRLHSYHIYNMGSFKGQNFVCLRNPWGSGEWEGKYSRNYDLIPEDLKKFFDYDHLPSGSFWMSFEDFFKYYDHIYILKSIHPDWIIKMFPIFIEMRSFSDINFRYLQAFAIKIKQQIPKGKKCRIHFLVEKRSSFSSLSDGIISDCHVIVASISDKKNKRVDLSKIKDERRFESFILRGDIGNFSFDIESNEEIVFVSVYTNDEHCLEECCYINVICKYDFDLYNTNHPEKLFEEVKNPGYTFENTASKCLTVKNFDKKLEFTLDTVNLDDFDDNEERDELIGKLYKYKKLDFEKWQVDINMYTKVQENPLGDQTNGTVFLVKQEMNDKLYAAKVLRESVDLNFLRELSILYSLRYPSIIHFIAFSNKDFDGQDHPTIITEYLKGGSLYDFIKKVHIGTCSWTSTDKMIILIGIAFGMNYLRNHEIMHRDLKLQNILLDDNMTPKICDFSKSKNYQIELDNGQVEIVGTPLFMAPEIKKGLHYSFQIDVYSFGVIAYYIYTDQFPDESHPIDLDKLDSKFKKFVSSMIDEDPEKRPTFDTITKMYLNNFDETWIDGADTEKVEIYLHQLGEILKHREHHLELELIRSITPEVYPENARKPIIKIDEILNNPNIPESLSTTLIKANNMLQSGVTDINEARSIYHKAGCIFYKGCTLNDISIQPNLFYAIQFLREASLLKNRDSMCMLSRILAESNDKDCQKIAFKIATMLANLGFPEAEKELGEFYLNGIGTDKNIVMSALYFKLAADKGYNESKYLFAKTLITNSIFIKLVPDQEQNEQRSNELKLQIEKAQQIVDQMKGISNKIYKEFLLTKDAIFNPEITKFVAKRYIENAAREGVVKENDELLNFVNIDAKITADQNIPDFADDITQASISISIEDDY